MPLLMAILVAVIYANATHGPFLLDDESAIEQNVTIRHLWPMTVWLDPPLQTPVTGRPIANLAFALNYAFDGLQVEGYHLVNIAIHFLVGLALFGVLSRTFARTPLFRAPPSARSAALVCTLLWLVHPLNSETVDYVTQRTESLAALFVLLAIYASIRALEGGTRWTIAAGALALCAVASKESGVLALFLVMLWDRAFAFPSLKTAWASRRAVYGALALSWLFFAVIAPEVPFFRAHGFAQEVSRWTYLATQTEVIPRYLWLSVWPRYLVFDYGPVTGMPSVWWPGAVLIVTLAAAVAVAMRRSPSIAFWGLWFFITLAPTAGLVAIPTEVGAERRMYLPLIGVICVLAEIVVLLRHRARGSDAAWRVGLTAVTAIAIVALAAMTVVRNEDYRSGLAMWQTVIERRPHWRAHEHLSMYLRDAGRLDEAVTELRLSAPFSRDSRHALAASLLERGKLDESLAEFQTLMATSGPVRDLGSARREYARALVGTGHREAAIAQLRLNVTGSASDVRSRLELADLLRDTGDVAGAEAAYREVLASQPDNVVALVNLGVLLATARHDAEAMPLLQRSLSLDPNQPAARLTVVQLLLAQGRDDAAEAQARTLVASMPTNAEAHNLLGVALAGQRRLAPAPAEFEEAVRLEPGNRQAAQNLQQAIAVTGSHAAGPHAAGPH
jgi:Flp pilus assembly protein TadD